MKTKFFASLALALALLTPACTAAAKFEAGARHFVMFDQPQKFAAALDRALATMFEPAAK
jgi:hypothetical protein